MLGWVFLLAWSVRINATKAVPVAVIQLQLLVIPAVLFFELSASFPSSDVYRDALLLASAVSLFFVAGTVFEVNYADAHRQSSDGLSKLINWDALREMPRNEIWRVFLSSNYHEAVLAIVGTILGIALRG